MQNSTQKKFKAVYIEITNVCNLNCSFCIGTKRAKRFMTAEEFLIIAKKVKEYSDYIYLHVLGEPLLHTELKKILDIADSLGLTVNITTNGTLIKEREQDLLSAKNLRKVAVSLHSFEGNGKLSGLTEYLENVYRFIEKTDSIVELRLWNRGGKDNLNSEIESFFSRKLNVDIEKTERIRDAKRLRDNLFLVYADTFSWPSLSEKEKSVCFCHGLDTHFGILVDGTVVPCCLDSEGTIALGNALTDNLKDVLTSERATAIKKGFTHKKPSEELCRKCGYATRFK